MNNKSFLLNHWAYGVEIYVPHHFLLSPLPEETIEQKLEAAKQRVFDYIDRMCEQELINNQLEYEMMRLLPYLQGCYIVPEREDRKQYIIERLNKNSYL